MKIFKKYIQEDQIFLLPTEEYSKTHKIYQDIFEQKNRIVINTSSITLSEIYNLLKRNKKIIQESYLPSTSLEIKVNGKIIEFDVAMPHFQEILEALEKYVEINI